MILIAMVSKMPQENGCVLDTINGVPVRVDIRTRGRVLNRAEKILEMRGTLWLENGDDSPGGNARTKLAA